MAMAIYPPPPGSLRVEKKPAPDRVRAKEKGQLKTSSNVFIIIIKTCNSFVSCSGGLMVEALDYGNNINSGEGSRPLVNYAFPKPIFGYDFFL